MGQNLTNMIYIHHGRKCRKPCKRKLRKHPRQKEKERKKETKRQRAHPKNAVLFSIGIISSAASASFREQLTVQLRRLLNDTKLDLGTAKESGEDEWEVRWEVRELERAMADIFEAERRGDSSGLWYLRSWRKTLCDLFSIGSITSFQKYPPYFNAQLPIKPIHMTLLNFLVTIWNLIAVVLNWSCSKKL